METQRKNRLQGTFDQQYKNVEKIQKHLTQLKLLRKETEGLCSGLPVAELIEDMECLKALEKQRLHNTCVELKLLGWSDSADKW
jgi:hypothetical protein